MISVEVIIPDIIIGSVYAKNCRAGPSPEPLLVLIRQKVEQFFTEREMPYRAERRNIVRDMLRHGKYRPTGRGKPASEYIEREALHGRFPFINVFADICNFVSLVTLLPMSIIDVNKAGSRSFCVRRGRAGEAYVFNQSGQSIDLEDLLVLSALPDDIPCASPVKDSQKTKTDELTTEVLTTVYAPVFLEYVASEAIQMLARLLEDHAMAEVTYWLSRQGEETCR